VKTRRLIGFSLVELLTVIAILSVITALLFPIMVEAKRSAKVEVGKQYLRQQFVVLELYSTDAEGIYPSYQDVISDPSKQIPCSPLYDWTRPCWSVRKEKIIDSFSDKPSPLIGGRGYLYAIKNWQEIDELGKDQFLGWDRNKAYPILVDIFASKYRVNEFEGSHPSIANCNNYFAVSSNKSGCLYPDTLWYAYTDGSLRVWRRRVDNTPVKAHQLFDWVHVFTRQMDNDTVRGN
jgi:prepilin-type N-terminal cleavage/methylation domain-containing protein